MKQEDRISPILFLVLSLFVCGHATQIGIGNLQQPGPGFLVLGAGAGVGFLALWQLSRSIMLQREGSVVAGQESPLRTGRFLMLCISLFLYILAVSQLGFLGATFLFSTIVFRLAESESWRRTLLKAAMITAGNYLLFVVWLGLSLPKGVLPW